MFHITISCIYLFLTPNGRSVVRAGVSLNIHSFIRFMFTMMCFMFMIWNPAVFKHCRLQLYLIGLYIICICYREVFITCASQSKQQIVEFELISIKKAKSALWGNFNRKIWQNPKKTCKMDVHFRVGITNLSTHLSRHHKMITEDYVFCFH